MTTVALEGFHCVKHALRFAPDAGDGRAASATSTRARALAERLAPDVADALLGRAVGRARSPTTRASQATGGCPAATGRVLRARTSPLVLLDAPRSPGNAGAVVRVAAAAGASAAWPSPARSTRGTRRVLRGSAGLHYALPVLRRRRRGGDGTGGRAGRRRRPAGRSAGTTRSWSSAASAAAWGSSWRERADLVLALPMRSGVSSLNLATAVAAALYRPLSDFRSPRSRRARRALGGGAAQPCGASGRRPGSGRSGRTGSPRPPAAARRGCS